MQLVVIMELVRDDEAVALLTAMRTGEAAVQSYLKQKEPEVLSSHK